MLAERLEFRLEKIDDSPVEPGSGFVVWVSGRVQRIEKGQIREYTREEILEFIARIGANYYVTDRDFGHALDKIRVNNC